MKSYLTGNRGLEPDRVVIIDGGIASCLTQELWVVPLGATPQARADAYLETYEHTAYKFDEHHYVLPFDPGGLIYWSEAPDDLFSYLEAFARALRKDKAAVGYLVAYKSARQDGPSVVPRMLKKEENYLVKEFGIKASRIKVINGGRQQYRKMELWVVPAHADAPVITTYQVYGRQKRH